jgi:hypothetical protein
LVYPFEKTNRGGTNNVRRGDYTPAPMGLFEGEFGGLKFEKQRSIIQLSLQRKVRCNTKEMAMKDIKEIRFVATNYLNLQGLKMVAIGVFGILVVLWGNTLKYPISTRSWIFLALVVVVSSAMYYGFDRYYLKNFGQVKRTPESKRLEWLVGIGSGLLVIGAFYLEASYKFRISIIGLVFSLGLLADYIRITWLVKGRHLFYYPIGVVLAVVLSLLPLFGLQQWWKMIGIRGEALGIVLFVGLFSIFAGIWGHLYLVRTLSTKVEEQ